MRMPFNIDVEKGTVYSSYVVRGFNAKECRTATAHCFTCSLLCHVGVYMQLHQSCFCIPLELLNRHVR